MNEPGETGQGSGAWIDLDWGINYTIDTTLVANAFDATKNDITVNISAPMSDAAIVDVFGLFQAGNLGTSVSMVSQ